MKTRVDNPGTGHCAFYAFSIALIDVIKHEYGKFGYSPTLNRWIAYDPTIEACSIAIRSFNFKHQNRDLLDGLQQSLREIVYQEQYSQLQDGISIPASKLSEFFDGKSIFNKFAALFWDYFSKRPLDTNYNDLAKSPAVKKLALDLYNSKPIVELEKLRVELESRREKLESRREKLEKVDEQLRINLERINNEITRTFLTDVYGKKYASNKLPRDINDNYSEIIKAINRIKQPKPVWWGTYSDLNLLATAFAVSLNYSIDGIAPIKFNNLPNDPVIEINNESGVHWTTLITTSNSIENSSTKNYQRLFVDSLITKEEIKQIYLTYTTGACAFFNTRNHLSKAKEIILFCDDKTKTIEQVIEVIRTYVNDGTIRFNDDSSFMKRANYIFARNEYYNGINLNYEEHNVDGLQPVP